MSIPKRVLGVYSSASPHWVGDGFPVRNLIPSNDFGENISPFLMLDYAGPKEFPPTEKPRGVDEHPHRGFETVTIVYQGNVAHRDSAGNAGTIGPGDVQWMTAASGVVHEEKHEPEFARRGGVMEMIQLWVNLPRAQKFAAPRYQDLRASEVALVSSADGGALVRVIAGEVAGHAGPGSTYTPMTLVHATLSPGARLTLPWRADYNALVYGLAGFGTVGAEKRPIQTGQLAVFGEGNTITIDAEPIQESRSPGLDVLILGGRPIREPVAWMGPFVMNTRDELLQAYADFQAGRLGSVPAVHNTPTHVIESRQEPPAGS